MTLTICLVGVDGSGKTTAARSLQEALIREGIEARYLHLFHRPILLWPLKLAARFLLSSEPSGESYTSYVFEKRGVSTRHPDLARLYSWVWLTDYVIQARLLLFFASLRAKLIIMDRYVFDTAINASLSLGYSLQWQEEAIDRCFRFLPYPDKCIVLDVDEDISLDRKTDIPSTRYILERRKRYKALATGRGFKMVDGTKSQFDIAREIRSELEILAQDDI